MNREQQLLQILADVCAAPALLEHPETDLLKTGLLDSLAMIELLEGIEDVFGVTLEPTQIPREAWKNAQSILALIEN